MNTWKTSCFFTLENVGEGNWWKNGIFVHYWSLHEWRRGWYFVSASFYCFQFFTLPPAYHHVILIYSFKNLRQYFQRKIYTLENLKFSYDLKEDFLSIWMNEWKDNIMDVGIFPTRACLKNISWELSKFHFNNQQGFSSSPASTSAFQHGFGCGESWNLNLVCIVHRYFGR